MLKSHIEATEGIVEFKYKRDTVINNQFVTNKTAKYIQGDYTGTWQYPFTHTFIPAYISHITYEDNDVLYVFNGNTFDTVVNYAANIGDRWQDLRAYVGCVTRKPLNVIDTGHVVINNLALRKVMAACQYTVKFAGTTTATTTVSYTYTFVEKVIHSDGGHFRNGLFPVRCDKDFGLEEISQFTFCSYKDNNFAIYHPNCPEFTGISAIRKNLQIVLYPNPNSGEFKIFLPEPGVVKISDVTGEILFEKDFDAGEHLLKPAALVPGLYYLSANLSAMNFNARVMIE
jgi:hypothetical protein